jgi:carbon storage regulator
MLVLTRKCHQAVVVEEFGGAAQMLTVTVLEIRGTRVKLGFNVAKDVAVHRQEVWERSQGHNALEDYDNERHAPSCEEDCTPRIDSTWPKTE